MKKIILLTLIALNLCGCASQNSYIMPDDGWADIDEFRYGEMKASIGDVVSNTLQKIALSFECEPRNRKINIYFVTNLRNQCINLNDEDRKHLLVFIDKYLELDKKNVKVEKNIGTMKLDYSRKDISEQSWSDYTAETTIGIFSQSKKWHQMILSFAVYESYGSGSPITLYFDTSQAKALKNMLVPEKIRYVIKYQMLKIAREKEKVFK